MKGFEIWINDDAPMIAACDNLVTIVISVGYPDGDNLHIGGLDSSQYHLRWFAKQPEIGDKIKVRICEVDTALSPDENYPSDREEMKKEYYELKKQLEEEGKL